MVGNYRINDGYVLVYMPEHPRAYKTGASIGYVAEHILVAEKMLGRPLQPNEEVHHLDRNRNNNYHTNLLVLLKGQHTKLHNWLNTKWVIPKFGISNIVNDTGNRCLICNNPISPTAIYCSPECASIARRKTERPDVDQLGRDMVSMPMLEVGKKYGVSDNTIRKWCQALGLPFKHCEVF